MKLSSFPGCCTARVLRDFGGTPLSSGCKGKIENKEIRGWLEDRIRRSKGTNCLVVMTNSHQKNVNKILKELGFKHSDWMSKDQHPEAKIKLWWKEP